MWLFFLKSTVMATNKVTQSILPSFAWTLWGTGVLVLAAVPFALLPPGGVQMDLGKPLLVLRFSILVEDPEFYLVVEQVACAFPVERYCLGAVEIYWGITTHCGVENGNPLLYSCLENHMGKGTWWPTVHGVAKSWTRLNDWLTHTHTHTHTLNHSLSRHSVGLDWKIPKNTLPVERSWKRCLVERYQGNIQPGERYWVGLS